MGAALGGTAGWPTHHAHVTVLWQLHTGRHWLRNSNPAPRLTPATGQDLCQQCWASYIAVRIQHKSRVRAAQQRKIRDSGAGVCIEAASAAVAAAGVEGKMMERWPFRRVFRVVSVRGLAREVPTGGAPLHSPALALPLQGWWILCTATLCALPLTIWEFKNQGWSPHYQGAHRFGHASMLVPGSAHTPMAFKLLT